MCMGSVGTSANSIGQGNTKASLPGYLLVAAIHTRGIGRMFGATTVVRDE